MKDNIWKTQLVKLQPPKTVSGTTSSIRPVSSLFVLTKTSTSLLRAVNVPFAHTEVRLQVCCRNYGLYNAATSSPTEMLESGVHPPCSQTPPTHSSEFRFAVPQQLFRTSTTLKKQTAVDVSADREDYILLVLPF